MKSQSNAAAMVLHSNHVIRALDAEIKAVTLASSRDREGKVDELLSTAVAVTGTVTKRPVTEFMIQTGRNHVKLLTQTLEAAVEASELVMQKALIRNGQRHHHGRADTL